MFINWMYEWILIRSPLTIFHFSGFCFKNISNISNGCVKLKAGLLSYGNLWFTWLMLMNSRSVHEATPSIRNYKYPTTPLCTEDNIFLLNQRNHFLWRNGENSSCLFSHIAKRTQICLISTFLHNFQIFHDGYTTRDCQNVQVIRGGRSILPAPT